MAFLDNLTNAVTPTGIDNLKGVLSKRGGLAKTNRFAIFMQPPSQSLLNLSIQDFAASSLSGNFNVSSFVNDPRDIAILCESCSLPGKSIQTLEYNELGYRQPIKYPSGYSNEDVTFSFNLTGDYYIKKMFDKWTNAVIDPETYTIYYDTEYKTDVVIQQLNEQNIPIYGVKLRNAYPINVTSVELNNSSTDSTQKLGVTLTYDDFTEEGALKSALSGVRNIAGSLINLI
tara:strand:- start:1505 stop:2194 length:690 start_codon:yes stop_codon:yes gene_type:complete